jgi:general secretion pathway protein D
MLKRRYLLSLCGVALALLALTGDVAARTRKGDALLNEGRLAEAKGDWDAALDLYERAFALDPQNTTYMLAMREARFEAGQMHVDRGEKARSAGKYEDALHEFERALIADPGSSIALQDIRETERMRQNSKAGVNPDEAGLTVGDRARRDQEERVDSMLPPPQLKPTNSVIPMLKMNNQPPKVLYETVGKLAGINVIFDSAYTAPGRNFNVDLNNVTIDQAFDYLATLTRTFWKPLNASTIFVAEDNVTKRRDFEDDVVKVFYVKNATSVQEFQEIATAIRTVAEIRRVFTYNAQRAMIVRDTVDKVALAEKLVQDLDKPKAEVVVDVIVMSVTQERIRDLAATIATAGTAGINVPITFNGTSTTTTSGTTTTGTPTTSSAGTVALSGLAKLSSNQFTASLPGGLLQAMIQDTSTKVLNKPQVRASDGQKVTLKIGERVPYATGSFQTNTAAALVSTQFNYADVGVNIEMTPQVHSADEVTLHIEVTVSSVQSYVSIGSISQPVIGQQANIADIRMREGEVNILGGLNQTQDTANSNGIPGLVNIPILGKILFGNDHTDKLRSDLLIALIPHIVRTPGYTVENMRGIYAGTDQVVKINYAPKPAENSAPAGTPTPGVSTQGTSTQGSALPAPPSTQAPAASQPPVLRRAPSPAVAPVPPAPSGSPVPLAPPVPTASLVPNLGGGATNSSAATSPVKAMEAAAHVGFLPPNIVTPVGSAVVVNVELEGATDIATVGTLRVRYNPSQLRLNEISPGALLARDGVRLNTVKEISNEQGEAVISIARPDGAPGVSGSGAIAGLTFTAIAPGSSPVEVAEISVSDAHGSVIAASLGKLPVTVQ